MVGIHINGGNIYRTKKNLDGQLSAKVFSKDGSRENFLEDNLLPSNKIQKAME
jgi:hypothetical protein